MASKAVVFYTRGNPNDSPQSNANIGINEDAVNDASEVSSTDLADGNKDTTLAYSNAAFPGSITFDATVQKYFYVDNNQSSDNATIQSGSTVTGSVGPVLYSSLTAAQVNLGYSGVINGLWDDSTNRKMYFTQEVLDGNNALVPGSTGLYVMNEAGCAATRIVSGLTNPNVLSLDLANNLVFFTDSTTGGALSGQSTAVNNMDVANLTTGTVKVLFSEPYVTDPTYGSASDSGKYLDGVAADTVNNALY